MFSPLSLLHIVLVLTLNSLTEGYSIQVPLKDGGVYEYFPSANIELVGNYKNKFYFADISDIKMIQRNVAPYCKNESFSMNTVTVESQDELVYLTSYGRNTTIPAGRYWTGGKTTNTYAWSDGTGTPVEDLYLNNDNSFREMCLNFAGASAAGERLWAADCFDFNKPLCQLVALDDFKMDVPA